MSLVNYRPAYLAELYHVDVKSYLWPWLEKGWDDVKGYVIRVKLLADEPVGFYSFRLVGDNEIMISKLCVHPTFRNLGIGTALHDDLVRIAKQYGKKMLKVMLHEENENRQFLIDRGWKAISISRAHFPDGCDGYLFQKEIR